MQPGFRNGPELEMRTCGKPRKCSSSSSPLCSLFGRHAHPFPQKRIIQFCHPDINRCRSIHLSAPISPLVSCWKWEGKCSHTTQILEVRTVSRKKKQSWAEQIPQEVASVVPQTLQVQNRTLFHLPALSLKLKGICSLPILGASLVAQLVKNLPTMQET